MTTTPEQIELARKVFTDAMMSVPQPDPILAAINAVRLFIRAEALEGAAKVVLEEREKDFPDFRSAAAAIRALKEKP